jgi:hypothetical protein
VIYAPQSSPGLRLLPACATALWLTFGGSLSAQDLGEISTDTRLRKEPEGVPLVSLPAGAEVETKRAVGEWHEVEVEGWIFSRSTEPTRRDGFDLVVTQPDGENIRDSPNGEVIGRVRNGTLLRKEESRGGWTHVRRSGWVPTEAIAPTPARAGRPRPTPPAIAADSPKVKSSTAATVATPPASTSAPLDRAELARDAAVYAAPEAGQYGTLKGGAPARVLGRSGEWARVQFEGWVHETDLKDSPDGVLTGITAAEVRADPARFVGRTVDWKLQLIAVQTADELRTEMARGQHYLLMRGPLPEPGFVYVTVSASQAEQFRSLQALQGLTLRVIIKAPKTKFLDTPVVELVSTVSDGTGS